MEGDCSFSFFIFLCSFSFCERKRTKKKAQEPAWVGPPRSPVSVTHIPRKKYFAGLFFQKSPAGKKWKTDDEDGCPIDGKRMMEEGCPIVCVHPPSPIRFLFFGSFFSFPERKERTEKKEEQKKRKNRKRECGKITGPRRVARACAVCAVYSMMLVTTPEPTVRPPSRMAKRSPCSMAMGVISLIVMRMLSPGMTISTPSGSSIVPVTSVVRK